MRFYIIDALALLYRAHFTVGHLQTKKGQIVGALYGWMKTFLKLLNEHTPNEPFLVAVVWDSRSPLKRKELFPDYKAHRKPMPEDLKNQIPLLNQILERLGIPQYQVDGYEADDVVASLAQKIAAADSENHVFIVGSDKDFFQIISPQICILSIRSKKETADQKEIHIFDLDFLKSEYDLTPPDFVTYFALQGDASDGIPGVRGVGEKTALKLTQQYRSLENLYDHLDEIKPPRIAQILKDSKEIAFLCRDLVRLENNLPLEIEYARWQIPVETTLWQRTFIDLMNEYEFRSLIPADWGQIPRTTYSWRPFPNIVFLNASESYEWQIDDHLPFVAFDLETTGIDPLTNEVIAFALTISSETILGFYGDEEALRKQWDICWSRYQHKRFVAHNAKFDIRMLLERGFKVPPLIGCTMILRSLVLPVPTKLSLKELVKKDYGVEYGSFGDLQIPLQKSDLSLWFQDQENLRRFQEYISHDVQGVWSIWRDFSLDLLTQKMENLYYQIEIPFLLEIVYMEKRGVLIDEDRIEALNQEILENLKRCEEQIFLTAGTEFNLKSPRQLGEILFDKIKIQDLIDVKIKKTSGGQYQTHKEFLNQFSHIPIIKLILEHRTLTKMYDTYTSRLKSHVHPRSGRIHTQYHQTGTVTGRLSSSNPNLQNIPQKGYWGEQIRSCFRSPSDYVLIVADYSQIELRILAHLADEQNMINAFLHGRDIHQETASKLFVVPYEEVTPEQRNRAKTINFGLLFGMSAARLSREQQIPMGEAQAFIRQYFSTFPSLEAYRQKMIHEGLQYGYVTTMHGRRRDVSPMRTSSPRERRNWENICLNTPIQGSEAEIVKMGMNRFGEAIRARGWDRVHMILQVHDEIVIECPVEQVEEVRPVLKKSLEDVCQLKVPLLVEIGTGRNWYRAKS